MIVDTVLEVVNFKEDEIEQVPNYGTHLEVDYIVGMGNKDETLNILLNIDKIVASSSLPSDAHTLHGAGM